MAVSFVTVAIDRYMLGDGDLLTMKGGSVQKHWKHAIMQNKKIQNGRINLTFRTIKHPESIHNN